MALSPAAASKLGQQLGHPLFTRAEGHDSVSSWQQGGLTWGPFKHSSSKLPLRKMHQHLGTERGEFQRFMFARPLHTLHLILWGLQHMFSRVQLVERG